MHRVGLFLELLNKRIPPGEGQRHNLTLNNNGKLELTLMLGEKYVPFQLEEIDLDLRVLDLVETIQHVLKESGT